MVTDLLHKIGQELISDVEGLESYQVYPTSRQTIQAPAVFLEVGSCQPGDDPVTGELSLVVNIEARVVVDATFKDAELYCQSLVYNIARVAHLSSFGLDVSPARISGITLDSFKAEFDPYICWWTGLMNFILAITYGLRKECRRIHSI